MNTRETSEFHTRILRVTLAVEESFAFWSHAGLDATAADLNVRAFEERWYGSKSPDRVKKLHEDFFDRYSFPGARPALKVWAERGMPADARRLCAHWHLQLVDPLYRAFTGDWLPARRAAGHGTVDRDAVMPWIGEVLGTEYAPATRQMFAGKLLTSAGQAGLVGPGSVRDLQHPAASLEATGYLLYLLRGVQIDGSPLDNPYLRSVGLSDERLDSRLGEGTRSGWWQYTRSGGAPDVGWTSPDLPSWAEATR